MHTERMKPEEMLRNPLCVRFDVPSHQRLTDAAWRRRMSASALVRELVARGLDADLAEGKEVVS